ncbi:MAG TPA: hypothetical protein VJR50_08925 [Mycobacterium sp.]|jgi:hypothetical protein|nr:hypothetical protein [Mycobacterium sp.]
MPAPHGHRCDENYCAQPAVAHPVSSGPAGRIDLEPRHLAWYIALSPLSCALVSTNKGTSVTAVQDWLNIRPFDPRPHVMSFISALRGVASDDAADVLDEPVLIRPGVERC